MRLPQLILHALQLVRTELESCLHGSAVTICWNYSLPLGGYDLCYAQIFDQFSPNLSNADMNDTVLINYSTGYYRALLSIEYKLFFRCNSTNTDWLDFRAV